MDNIAEEYDFKYDSIKDFAKKCNWYDAVFDFHFSEKFMITFAEDLPWTYLAKYQKLSERFLELFKNNLELTKVGTS